MASARGDDGRSGSGVESVVAARDERPHAPGDDPRWAETWSFAWAAPDGRTGGFTSISLLPHLGRAWYTACLVGPDRPLVVVADHDVPLPRSGLEVRTEGLWAAHNLETPLDHWSLACEAFAVATEDATEVHGDLRGDRVPFGHDLEWETDGAVLAHPGSGRYEVPCLVTGEVLVGPEVIEVDGPGWRDHTWGPASGETSARSRGWLAQGGPPLALEPGGVEVVPIASVTERISTPDGRSILVARTLIGTADGGVGWTEHAPPPHTPPPPTPPHSEAGIAR